MTVVIDASVVVAFLVEGEAHGQWSEDVVTSGGLVAPHHLPFEVANVLRRAAAAGSIGPETAALAHADLLDLPIALVPYLGVADRVWELRSTLTSYDAAYVALAERLDAPLATLDGRLARAPGPTCRYLQPPG